MKYLTNYREELQRANERFDVQQELIALLSRRVAILEQIIENYNEKVSSDPGEAN